MADPKYKSIAIVHHTYTLTSLVEEELRAYLLSQSERIDYVTLPFKAARDGVSPQAQAKQYLNGKLAKTQVGPSASGPEPFYFWRDISYVWRYIWSLPTSPEIYFGVDNLNAFTGILLRRFGKVKKVVYYVIDYVPQRFANPILNTIYRSIDRFCVKYADQTWNLADPMKTARTASGLPEKYEAKQITVPVGTHLLKPTRTQLASAKTIKLVFLGILNEDQGIDRLIDIMPALIEAVPKLELTVIGSGPLAEPLKTKARELQIDQHIKWLGYVESNEAVAQTLAGCHLGVAPYKITDDGFKHYTDPGKIKTYLGAGLPIVMTPISHIAAVIKKKQAGLIAEDSTTSLIEQITALLTDVDQYEKFATNAAHLAQAYQWSTIYDQAFSRLHNEK